jgi:hypothetical protein
VATLHPPFSGLEPGKHNLQLSLLGWHTVGSCSITANDDYHFAASGSYDALGHKGTFEIALTLTDKNPDAASGPCIVTNGGQTVTGTYSKTVQQSRLVTKITPSERQLMDKMSSFRSADIRKGGLSHNSTFFDLPIEGARLAAASAVWSRPPLHERRGLRA